MPEVEISIGGRQFEVACAAGEEHYLIAAAKMLDQEASALTEQIGRLPEARMLLMAGLMLADRTAGLEDKLREAGTEIARLSDDADKMRSAPKPPPERVEVPVVPTSSIEALEALAGRAEALADTVESKARNG